MEGDQSKADEKEESEPVAVLVPINSPSEQWSTAFLATSIWSMPDLGDLSEYLKQELPLKIDIKSSLGPHCGVGTMFRINYGAPCEEFKARVLRPIKYGPNIWGVSESSYISTWNIKIASVLSFALSNAVLTRYWNHSTCEMLHWPNFLLKWNSVNVLRGEELEPFADMEIARERLRGQMLWIFGDEVPYLFGYTASGYMIELFALVQSKEDALAVDFVHLSSYDISRDPDTFRLMLALLNIGRLVQCLAKLCSESARREYDATTRVDGVILRMTPKYVIKDYSRTELFELAARHLSEVNDILTSKNVPNVETLVEVKKSVKILVFQPRGDIIQPRDLAELFDMLFNVLETLEALHEAGWMHRNICWDSINKHFSNDKGTASWFLTNFDFAAKIPQPNLPGRQLAKGYHPPEQIIPGVNHTSALDLWSLGHLIRNSSVGWDDEAERTQFADWLVAIDPSKRPSTSDALKRLLSLKENYHHELQQLEFMRQREADEWHDKLQTELEALEEKRLEKEKRQDELEKKRLENQQQLANERLKKKRHKQRKRQHQKKKKGMAAMVD